MSVRSANRCVFLLVASLAGQLALAGCPPPYSGSGHATFYSVGGFPSGACSVDNVDGETTAITSVRWNGSAHCGECLDVKGPLGSVRVRITDECPTCTASDLDLTAAAFAQIANPTDGVAPISWERVDCSVTDGLVLQVQDGGNPYYLSLLVDNANQGIASIAVRSDSASAWIPLTRLSYGYFNISPSGPLQFPLSVQLTSTSNEVLDLAAALTAATGGAYPTKKQFDGCTDRIFANDFGASD